MTRKRLLLAPAVAATLLATPALASSASAATVPAASTSIANAISDPVLSDSASLRLSGGKYVNGSSSYQRSTNKLSTSLHVATPYLFVGARGSITTTLYADTPFGPMPVWTVSHGLTACALWDPTCPSSPAQTWTDMPAYWDWAKVQQYAAFLTVAVDVT